MICLFIYRPLRKFIISFLDSNISKIQNEFKLSNDILESSKKNIEEANKKLNEAMLESDEIAHEIDKIIKIDLKKINDEFEYKSKRLYLNNQEMIEKLNNTYITEAKNQIVKLAFQKLKAQEKYNISISVNDIQILIDQII